MSMEDTARVQPMIDPDTSGSRLGDDTPPVSTLVGVFDSENAAHDAIQDLKLAGFSGDSISFVSRTGDDSILRNDADITDAADVHDDKGPEGALVGSLTGGTLGAVLGFLLAGGTALIPGVGPVIAAGVFGATVTGALVGGSVGGITGGLAGMGVPDEDAGEYEGYFKEGKPIVAVRTLNGNQMESARDVFDRHGANATRTYGDTRMFNDNSTTGLDTADTIAPVPGTGAGAMAAAAYTTNNNATNRPVMPPDEPTSRTTDTLDYGTSDTTTTRTTTNDDLRGMVRPTDETDNYDTTRRASSYDTDRRDDFNTPAATMAAGGIYPPVNRDDDVLDTPSKYDNASVDDVTDPEQVRNPRDENGNIIMPKAPFPPQNKMS